MDPPLDRTLRIEHPLEVGKLNRSSSSHLEPGGKGINVSRAVKALGGNSIALGFTAGTNGRVMKDMLTAADIHYDFVDVAGQLRVNTQILDAQGGHTEVNEPGSKLDDADFLRLIDRMENYLDEGNIFVLAGSTPPDFPLKNYRKLCKTIKRHGCKLIIDAQGDLLLEALQCEPDFVKPNIFELAEAVGDKPSADPEVVVHSARKMRDMGARAVCVSMSQEGAVLVSKDESEALYVNTNPKVYDEGAVGTGDAMVGAIANSMQSGLKFDEMARYAVATFIDTAGIRKKSKVDEKIEKFSVMRSLLAVERADVCVIMIDATEGVTEQDTKVAGEAHNAGKACIIVVNKWDLVEKDGSTMKEYTLRVREGLAYMPYAPVLFISAQTGQRVDKLFALIHEVYEQNHMRIPTGRLNAILAEATARVQPPTDKGRRLRIFYMTQASTCPPTFVCFCNDARLFHFSYQRYLENQIREVFGLTGTPVRMVVRERGDKE